MPRDRAFEEETRSSLIDLRNEKNFELLEYLDVFDVGVMHGEATVAESLPGLNY